MLLNNNKLPAKIGMLHKVVETMPQRMHTVIKARWCIKPILIILKFLFILKCCPG